MTELAPTSKCRSYKAGEPYEPCDCYVHDFVAELLGIVSTTGRDFRPGSTKKGLERRVEDSTRHLRAEHDALMKKFAELEAEKLRKEEVAAVSKRLLAEKWRSLAPVALEGTAPIVLGEGMIVENHAYCDTCHSNNSRLNHEDHF